MKRNKIKRPQQDDPNRESKYACKVRLSGAGTTTMHRTRLVTINGFQRKVYITLQLF